MNDRLIETRHPTSGSPLAERCSPTQARHQIEVATGPRFVNLLMTPY